MNTTTLRQADWIVGLVDNQSLFSNCFIISEITNTVVIDDRGMCDDSFTIPQLVEAYKTYPPKKLNIMFRIRLPQTEIQVLNKLKKHFQCGQIVTINNNFSQYQVTNIAEIRGIILRFFEKNPLSSRAVFDFLSFRKVVEQCHFLAQVLNYIETIEYRKPSKYELFRVNTISYNYPQLLQQRRHKIKEIHALLGHRKN